MLISAVLPEVLQRLQDRQAMLALLAAYQRQQLLSQLDLAFARFLAQNAPTVQPMSLLLAAFLSRQVGRGHVCLPLADLLADAPQLLNYQSAQLSPEALSQQDGSLLPDPALLLASYSLEELEACLAQCDTVLTVTPANAESIASAAPGRPLVLDQQILYFARYWSAEQQIAADLRALMQAVTLPAEPAQLKRYLDQLFGAESFAVNAGDAFAQINWQKLACANSLRSRFSVITGGPGTGKTYTLVRLLALLQRLSATPLTIKLAAPTGKAAARMKEAITQAMQSLQALAADWQPAVAAIRADSATLHKLLGVQAGSRQFKHQRSKPLALDVLIVDEASMIDIELMQALLAALPADGRLILLGDKDQLASVEAGAILGQLCQDAEQGGYSAETMAYLQQFSAAPIPAQLATSTPRQRLQQVVMLRVSRRFDQHSGIGALARAVNQGEQAQVDYLLSGQAGYQDLQLLAGEPEQDPLQQLAALCRRGFAAYWQQLAAKPAADAEAGAIEQWARAVLNSYQQFQLLTAVREGPFGVAGLNQLVQQALPQLPASRNLQQDSWYEGRPVMISSNDYNLNLRNGDIGIVLVSPQDQQKRVVFIDADNQLKWILPSRLGAVETVFAMTVHKSQGSEFRHTVLVLPERDNPVLCRELLYTGITRAAKQLTLVVPDYQVLKQAVQRRTVRAGRLPLDE